LLRVTDGVAACAVFVATFVFFVSFAASLARLELVVVLDRFRFFVILSPLWNSRTIRVFREK
jgi:hypothetical protein